MGRPRIKNPKNKHIGIVTTEEKYYRFKKLGLIGDEAVDVLLYYLENDKTKLNVQKQQAIRNIQLIQRKIEDLEYEKLKEETKLETINEEIGVNKENGLRRDVDSAINTVLQRFNNVNEIYNINQFINYNKKFIENQAYLCNVSFEEFKELLYAALS